MDMGLPEIAARLCQKARTTGVTVADLEAECPWLCQQVVRDAATDGLFGLWSDTSNFDELAGVPIVDPDVLLAIGNLAGHSMEGPAIHAGLQHTYGYLLSTIETRFGYKRDRWVNPSLAQGFGLPPDILGPNPAEGTLLANATFLAGTVAFRGDERAIRRLRKVATSAASWVSQLQSMKFEQDRIVETLYLRDSAGRSRSIRIRTDIVRYPHQVMGTLESYLLVYSVKNSRRVARLTTLFPITQAFAAELTHPDRFGPSTEIRLRFNAFLPGLAGQTVVGQRTLERVVT
ncbi:MAG TPA: hypothetical protein VFG20_17560 [Planctomycetaceae bacterium]|jgi:hypothetical protein|nr:hypothetical protein [Planctomycetaceae bacterium]